MSEPMDPQMPPDLSQPEPQRPSLRSRLGLYAHNLVHTHIDKSTWRIRLVALGFACLFGVIGGRLVYFGFKPEQQSLRRAASEAVSRPRPQILDRNGEVLASSTRMRRSNC